MAVAETFDLEFKLGNAAFDGAAERPDEIARILRHVADQVEGGTTDGLIHDLNGNHVGRWAFPEWEDDQPDCCPDPDLDANGVCENCGTEHD